MKLTKKQRHDLRLMFDGHCAYCGCELPERGWHADHIEPVLREWWKSQDWWKERHLFRWEVNAETGSIEKMALPPDPAGVTKPENDTIENLFPSCRACNIDKHASSLDDWRRQLQGRVDVCRRNYSAFRHAERFGLIQEVKKPVVFWFEQFKC